MQKTPLPYKKGYAAASNPMSVAYASNDEFFRVVSAFADRLNAEGHASAAAEVKGSFSCLNGLTDGWALFGESLEDVRARHGSRFTTEQQAELDGFISTVWDVVHRR